MKKQLSITILALLTTLTVQAQVFIGKFEAIEKGDTLLVGFFRNEDMEKYNTLMKEWNVMKEKEMQTAGVQRNNEELEKHTPTAANAEIAKMEKQRADALKEIDKVAGMLPADQVAKMKKDINDSFDKMIKDTPGRYADISTQMKEQNANLTKYDSSTFSSDKKYALKRRFAALAVDRKLHGYSGFRDYRHGRAAVSRNVQGIGQRWGFVDETGREVLPCIYYLVCDFNNVSRTVGHGVSYEDADSKGWTTVWNNGMGMVDRNGNIKIPCKFEPTSQYQRIIFYQTPKGEFAQVRDADTKKYGIIDRQGDYTMQPTETHPIIWYNDLKCFGYRTDDGRLVTFDAYGKIENK